MNKKKLLTLSLCLIIATIGSLSAQTVGDQFKVGKLYYRIINLSPNEVAVVPQKTDYPYWDDSEKPTGEITIPTTITYNEKTYSVTNIGKYTFYKCTGLTNITIPNSVTNIGNYAFSDCSGLTNITIPNSVTNIGEWAFFECTGLTNITIPNSVTSIESHTFADCTGLTNISIPSSVTNIGNRAFYDCTGLSSITIPNSVTNIGNSAFYKCAGLINITIPNSVTNIGNRAFYDCTGLTSITSEIADLSKLTMGWDVFGYSIKYNCILYVPKGKVADYQATEQWTEFTKIAEIGTLPIGHKLKVGQLYYQITSLSPYEIAVVPQKISFPYWNNNEQPTGEITIATSVSHNKTTYAITSIGNSVFSDCTGLTSITIPNSVTNIGNYAFYQCTGLTNITISNSVTNIGESAFRDCTGLTSITIPNSVTNIGRGAFINCTGLTSTTIPNSVTNIGNAAFSRCSGLTSITIPNSITNIGKEAFYDCESLTSITSKIANLSQLTIGRDVFDRVNKYNCILYVPKGKVADYQAAEQWKEFTYTAEIGTVGYRFKVGKLYYQVTNLSPKEVAVVPQKIAQPYWDDSEKPTGEITIPTSVSQNGTPYSVTNIGLNAFIDCTGLTNITIPNSVTNIGNSAFSGCTGLLSITSKIENLSQLTIGRDVFDRVNKYNCILYVPKGKVADYQAAEQWKEFTYTAEIGKLFVGHKFKVGKLYYQIINLLPQKVTVVSGNEKPTGEITIPTSVTQNGTPYSVTNIGLNAFRDCTGLTNVTIPNSITSIGHSAFESCTGLTSITIPNSVKNIGNYAFSRCTGLTNITIPNSVTKIGEFAFRGCTGVSSITSETADLSQLTIGWGLFYDVDKNNCILYVPKGKVTDYQAARQWKEFKNIKEIEGSGISQVDAERYIALSPNPARDEVTISIAPALVEQVSSLTLLDSNGKALQTRSITDSETIIDLTRYTSGIYFVQIDNVVKKLIIK